MYRNLIQKQIIVCTERACRLDEIVIRTTIRSITSHLVILQCPKLTDWRTDLAVAPEPANQTITMCMGQGAFTICACTFILISSTLCILLPFRVLFRVPAFTVACQSQVKFYFSTSGWDYTCWIDVHLHSIYKPYPYCRVHYREALNEESTLGMCIIIKSS